MSFLRYAGNLDSRSSKLQTLKHSTSIGRDRQDTKTENLLKTQKSKTAEALGADAPNPETLHLNLMGFL